MTAATKQTKFEAKKSFMIKLRYFQQKSNSFFQNERLLVIIQNVSGTWRQRSAGCNFSPRVPATLWSHSNTFWVEAFKISSSDVTRVEDLTKGKVDEVVSYFFFVPPICTETFSARQRVSV